MQSFFRLLQGSDIANGSFYADGLTIFIEHPLDYIVLVAFYSFLNCFHFPS